MPRPTFLVLPSPPLPVIAHQRGVGQPVTVDFDQGLQADPAIDTDNWVVRLANNLWETTSASVTGARVTLTIGGFAVPDVGPNVVSFSPPPFDVLSTPGLPAAAFADFPLEPA